MPTTMNAIALNRAWAMSSTIPACVAAVVPAPNEDDEEAELADRAIGEQQLEVVLAQRAQPAGDHRDEADGEHERAPRRDHGEHRGEAAEQVHAGLDHRRRVQIGAHRRRRGHRPGEPRVERVLRRLGERPDRPRTRGPTVTARAARRIGEDLRHLERAGGVADQDETGEQHQPAGRRDEQGLQRRGAGGGAVCAGRRSTGTT